jgi:general nucleoside transport system permease protein
MEGESWLVSTLSRALAFSTPLLWGALGEIYAERAGVINLGIEGMMILGAFVAFAVAHNTGNPGLGLLGAAAVGSLAALLHAFVVITLRANQYVSGLALSMVGLGSAGLLGRGWVGLPLPVPLADLSLPGLATLPLVGPALFTSQSPLTYLGVLLAVVLWLVLYCTRWGLVLRSTGEAPAAADALGVSVTGVRYLAVVFGGALAGIAGGFLSVAYRPAWTEGMTAGMGWIAIAIVIFAAWNPLRALGGALLFGALYHLAFRLQAWMAPELLRMLPYACTIVVLTLNALGKHRHWQGAPEALGLPYVRGER